MCSSFGVSAFGVCLCCAVLVCGAFVATAALKTARRKVYEHNLCGPDDCCWMLCLEEVATWSRGRSRDRNRHFFNHLKGEQEAFEGS